MDDHRSLRFERRQGKAGSAADETCVAVEVSGLSLFTHHGVTDAEQREGQRLVLDISFEIEGCDATVSDRIEDTIDYRAVCDTAAQAATERSHRTLERVCTVVADALEERFRVTGVVVRAAKPEPPMPVSVDDVSVEVAR